MIGYYWTQVGVSCICISKISEASLKSDFPSVVCITLASYLTENSSHFFHQGSRESQFSQPVVHRETAVHGIKICVIY